MEEENKKSLLTPVLIGLLVVAAFFVGTMYTKVQFLQDGGKELGTQDTVGAAGEPAAQTPEEKGPEVTTAKADGISTFSEKKDAEICTEDGKPIVYLFSTTWCPHCTWINDTFNSIAQEYENAGKIKAYHWEIDVKDDVLTPTAETEVPADAMAAYNEFNPRGSIPTFVFGCKYFRVGNGYESADDLDSEAAEFRAIIEDLIK
jgi:thiol-disulfide isomerase/thioredoxin